jgi:hypothetical protein
MAGSLTDMADAAPTGPIVIDAAHCGPPHSGNGGWTAGLLAERVRTSASQPSVTVRLTSPPPLDRPLTVGGYGSLVLLQDRSTGIATGSPSAAPTLDLPQPATAAEAEAAEARYEGLTDHPFPTCFSCGTGRSPEDALCLRPGPVADDSGRYAARWTPRESSVPLVWAALDCPGGWSAGIAGRPMVLGQMTAQVHRLPEVGVEHVVTAWPVGGEGRKFLSASMLSTPEGEVIAVATATWIAVDPESIRPADSGEGETR